MPLPPSFPPHAGLQAGVLGYLWVEEYTRPGEEIPIWLFLDPVGALVGRLSLPVRLSPLEIGPDYLLGVGRDELGVESVRLYRLSRPQLS